MTDREVISRLFEVGFEEIEESVYRHSVLGRFRIVSVGREWRVEVPRLMMARTGLSRAALSRQLTYASLEEAVNYLYKLGQTATTGVL